MMLSQVELEALQIVAQKDAAFGDCTTRVDSGVLCTLIDELKELRELVRYQEDLAKDRRDLEFN